jgi:hypothetical protein
VLDFETLASFHALDPLIRQVRLFDPEELVTSRACTGGSEFSRSRIEGHANCVTACVFLGRFQMLGHIIQPLAETLDSFIHKQRYNGVTDGN